MEITRTVKPSEKNKKQNVSLWHCSGCKVVHMSVGSMMLNFTSTEFAEFTNAVVDINATGTAPSASLYSILDLVRSDRDEAHPAETVH